MDLEPDQLIKKYTGNGETHTVTTEDGYILTIFRINRNNPRGVILLQHSLTVDSRVWIGQGKEKSLAFYLWNAGYEIWVSNCRGTQYSQKHTTLSVSDYRYWNFSFHEIGFYDLPSQINLIKKVSGFSQIIYIGHSQGASAGLVYSSLKPDEAKESVKFFIFMSTPCYYMHQTSPTRYLIPFESAITATVNNLKLGNALFFLPVDKISRQVFRSLPLTLYLVKYALAFFFGWAPNQADPTILNLDGGIYLKEFSWYLMLHYLQLAKAKMRFQRFDYGKRRNLRYYGTEKPPAYPLERVSVPIYFVSSYQDSLTSLQDTDLLIETLKNTTTIYGHWKVKGLSHMDYHFGRQKKELFYDQLVEVINKHSKPER
ncbi:lipase 1-like [Zophobas morio]|uniref:lipase 1-like n=1 Tax=Zophobas morio TaxID=2755281 RepID=UPI003082CA69